MGGFSTGQAEQGAGVGPPLPFAQGCGWWPRRRRGLGDVDGAAGPRHLYRLAGPPELPGKAEVGPGQPQGDRAIPTSQSRVSPWSRGEGGQPLPLLSRGDGDGGGRRSGGWPALGRRSAV